MLKKPAPSIAAINGILTEAIELLSREAERLSADESFFDAPEGDRRAVALIEMSAKLRALRRALKDSA